MWVFQDVLLVSAASVPEQPPAMSFSFAGRLGQVSALQRGLFCQAHMAGTGTAYTGSGDTAGHYVAQSWFTFDKRLDADAPAEAMAYVITRAGMGTSAFQQSVPSQRRIGTGGDQLLKPSTAPEPRHRKRGSQPSSVGSDAGVRAAAQNASVPGRPGTPNAAKGLSTSAVGPDILLCEEGATGGKAGLSLHGGA